MNVQETVKMPASESEAVYEGWRILMQGAVNPEKRPDFQTMKIRAFGFEKACDLYGGAYTKEIRYLRNGERERTYYYEKKGKKIFLFGNVEYFD